MTLQQNPTIPTIDGLYYSVAGQEVYIAKHHIPNTYECQHGGKHTSGARGFCIIAAEDGTLETLLGETILNTTTNSSFMLTIDGTEYTKRNTCCVAKHRRKVGLMGHTSGARGI